MTAFHYEADVPARLMSGVPRVLTVERMAWASGDKQCRQLAAFHQRWPEGLRLPGLDAWAALHWCARSGADLMLALTCAADEEELRDLLTESVETRLRIRPFALMPTFVQRQLVADRDAARCQTVEPHLVYHAWRSRTYWLAREMDALGIWQRALWRWARRWLKGLEARECAP
jgi:hypothetical protein